MEAERYGYSGIAYRPPLRWPGNARVALWVVPNVEHYEYLPSRTKPRDPWPRSPHPDVLGYSHRDYGNRVGFWRMLEVIDALQVRCSVSLNLGVYERFPEIMRAIEDRQWDIVCHGIYNTHSILGLSEAEELAYIRECVEKCRALTGRMFNGWFSPGLSYGHDTMDLIASCGVRYFCDWPLDDQPVPIRVKSGSLHAMPYQFDINDGIFFNRRYKHGDAEQFARMIVDQFDQLYADGEHQGRVMCIALHPYIIGQPHNIAALKSALEYILAKEGVWNATGNEILDWWIANHPHPQTSNPQLGGGVS